MIKPLLLLFIFPVFWINSAFAVSLGFDYEITMTYSESVGVDSSGNKLPSSDWEVRETSASANHCNDFNNTNGLYYNTNPEMRGSVYIRSKVYSNSIEYVDKNKNNCSGIIHPKDDPLNPRIVWNDMGLIQEESFELVSKNCGISNRCSDVIYNYEERRERGFDLSSVNKNGTNGSYSQTINVYTYNYDNVIASTTDGIAGKKGTSNILESADKIKYCYNIVDANVAGATFDIKKKPIANIVKFNWNAFDQGISGLNGVVNGEGKGKIYTIKGLDSSMREWIKDINESKTR